METNQALQEAIDIAGSQRALAEMIGSKQQLISYYLKNGLSPHLAMLIEVKTGVDKKRLCPNFKWEELNPPSRKAG